MQSAANFKTACTISLLALACAVRSFAGDASLIEERPLANRSGPRGATLFTQLPAADTGVRAENRFDDPRMWGERARQFEVGAIGTGVAVGDFDGDELPDIFVVRKTESSRLFRNLGGWKFADVTEAAGVADSGNAAAIWKQGAAFADVNNDGWLDLYVCRFAAPNLLYLNRGDGTFVEGAAAAGLAVADASSMAAFCDYDRDGSLDVYLLTNYLDAANPDGQRDYLFRNNGDGTFSNVTERSGILGAGYGHSATWWDYDGDRWPDLYVANDFATPDRLYRNNGDGTFTEVIDQVVPRIPFSAMGADLGDVNNDGWMDLFVAEMAATTHGKDQRTMAEVRSRAQDFDGSASLASPYPYNALFVNTGAGRCVEASFLAGLHATDWTWAVRFEDLDNDGRVDLHATNGMFREIHNADLMQRLLAAASPAERSRLSRASPMLAESNLAFRNLGDLAFEDTSEVWGLNQKGVSFGSAFGDFDQDGDLDLVYANYQADVTLLRNDSDSGHRLIVRLCGTRSNRFGVGAMVRIQTRTGSQMRQLVLARGYQSTSEPVLHFGLGNDAEVERLTVEWPSGGMQIIENVAADCAVVITEPNDGGSFGEAANEELSPQFVESAEALGLALVAREERVDELATQPLLPVRHSRQGPAVAVADVNGDGKDDIVIAGTTRDPLRVCIKGGARFELEKHSAASIEQLVNDGPVAVFDANGDGHDDLLVTSSGARLVEDFGAYEPRLFLGNGRGDFRETESALPSLAESMGALAVADFDRDGWLDVFLGGRVRPGEYPLSPRSALWRNQGGRFEDVTDALAPALRLPGMVTSALWSDVDLDGWPDLMIALEWGGVRFFRNREGRGFDDWSERTGFASAGTGWWTSLASADFNHDGRPDFVAGNAGLNTQYRASREKPALLFDGQFSDGRPPELLEAHYEGERLVPWRVRRQLGLRIPLVLKRFPNNNSYARATLEEIVGRESLAQAERFAATELRSGVFLSQTDGTYVLAPLPRMAQIAPLQGIAAGDFDGDGAADIYAVQNSFAPTPVVGPFNGGLGVLLRGDGRGGFSIAAYRESGLIVPGDAKALAVCDLDENGWPDFLVTRNNATALAFRNEGVAGRHSLQVRLRGKGSNASAIGARVVFVNRAGVSQSAEIQAGSGWSSQSAAACFFGYTDDARPERLQVFWPSGKKTVHAISPDARVVVLTEDAANDE